MKLRPPSIKTLFLAAGLALCGLAHAQKAPSTKRDFSDNLSGLKQTPKAGTQQATPQQAASKALKARTGILFVRGPEAPTHFSDYSAQAQIETKNFKLKFKDYPLRVVGDGIDSVGIDQITAQLDSLAEQDIDDIVMVNFMHGDMHVTEGDPDWNELCDGGKTFDNLLQYKKDGSVFSADSLYKSIGDRFASNPKLKDKHLILVHQSCHGETALNAFHFLPPHSQIFYYAGMRNGNNYEPYNNSFSVAFGCLQNAAILQHLPEPVLDRKTALTTAVMATNNSLKQGTEKNSMRYLEISEEAPDSLNLEGRTFFFGTHKGTIVRTDKVVDDILNKFDDKQIQEELKEFDSIVTPEVRQVSLNAYRNAKSLNLPIEGLSNKDNDYINFIALNMALKHPEYLQSAIHYAANLEVGGIEAPEDRVRHYGPVIFR